METTLFPLNYEAHMKELIGFVRKNSTQMPYGASIVDSKANTLVMVTADGLTHPLLHCEMAALLECGKKYLDCDWTDLTLFTIGEACSMCTSGMCWLGLKAFVYGATIRFMMDLLGNLGWQTPIRAEAMYRSDEVFEKYENAHLGYTSGISINKPKPRLIREVCKEECEQLVKDYLPRFKNYIKTMYKEFDTSYI